MNNARSSVDESSALEFNTASTRTRHRTLGTHNLSRRAVADLRLTLCGYWDRRQKILLV